MEKLTAGQKAKGQCRKDLEEMYGLEPDRWGNYKFSTSTGTYRIKFQKQTMRLEAKMPSGVWVRSTVSVSYRHGIKSMAYRLSHIVRK